MMMSEADGLETLFGTNWFIQTSPNDVDHLVVIGGNCATCGNVRGHDEWLTIERGPLGPTTDVWPTIPDDAIVEVMTLDDLWIRLRDWRLPVPNFVRWAIDGHRTDALAEVVWETRNGIRSGVYGVRRLTHD